MNGAIAWWARNPVAANLLMVGLVISGLLGYTQIGREVMPTVALNIVTVEVTWPGAAPEEIEEQVVQRIEQSLRDIGNIDKISSSAQEGFGQIVIEALPRVDRGLFVNSIKQRVDAVTSLPQDIEPPRVTSQVFRTPLIQLVVHGNTDELELKRLAEELRTEMALLTGISIVRLTDARREEVTIEVSEQSMQRYKVTFDEVAMAIRASSINLSAGSVRTQTGDIQLRSRHFASDQSDFEKIIIRHNARGGIVRVGDVARVIDGFEEDPSVAALNGERALCSGQVILDTFINS
jgi:multidrug efflux pump subunit AcrB